MSYFLLFYSFAPALNLIDFSQNIVKNLLLLVYELWDCTSLEEYTLLVNTEVNVEITAPSGWFKQALLRYGSGKFPFQLAGTSVISAL